MKRLHLFRAAVGLSLVLAGQALADSPDDARLQQAREALRSTTAQLQDAQSQLASLQATQAEQADENKSLRDQLAILRKHSSDDQASTAKSLEEFKAKAAEQEARIQQLTRTALAWKAAAEKAAVTARALAADRDRLAYQDALLQRKIDDLRIKNLTLFALGNEILTRYEKLGVGEEFKAKEPFIGESRTSLENLVQDYDDKLLAQRAGD